MEYTKKIGKSTVRLIRDDITDMDVDSFVFYAESDLKLGTGYGTAISLRGGQVIQKELDELAPREVGDAVVTSGGKLKAKHIIHAVGPKFQEPETEAKLHRTIKSALQVANQNGIKKVAIPPMGTGFYGIPRDICAKITMQAIKESLTNGSSIEEVIICVNDKWELPIFKTQFDTVN